MPQPIVSVALEVPSSTPKPHRARPKRATVEYRLVELAELVGSHDARRQLRDLAEAISLPVAHRRRKDSKAAGRRPSRDGDSDDVPISQLIDFADASTTPDAAFLIEAAAWALARYRSGRSPEGDSRRMQLDARSGSNDDSVVVLLGRMLQIAGTGATTSSALDGWEGCRLVLARLFADVESCRRLEANVAESFSRTVGAFTRPGGLPASGAHALVRQIESWARLAGIADETGSRPWGPDADGSLDLAVQFALRLHGPIEQDGSRTKRHRRTKPRWLVHIAEASPHKPSRRVAKLLKGKRTRARVDSRRSDTKESTSLLGTSLEKARRVALRSDWTDDATIVHIDAGGDDMRLELIGHRRVLIDGSWDVRIECDGVRADFRGPWEQTAHETEPSATFVEFSRPLCGGLRLERQIVHLHEDHCLLLADAVIPESSDSLATPALRAIDYAMCLPMGDGLKAVQPSETIEIITSDEIGHVSRSPMLSLPLELREWKGNDPSGRFGHVFKDDRDRIELSHRSSVGRLLAPVWLDLNSHDMSEPVTWRQLTVADMRHNLPRHRACGYRIRVGLRQWLVYRALDVSRNRTVLGCNLSCELLVGRIQKDGSIERLIEIQ